MPGLGPSTESMSSPTLQQPLSAYPPDLNLEILVPAATDFDTVSYVSGPRQYVKSRDTLFFEELVAVKIIFHGSVEYEVFQDLLSRTDLIVTANATSAAPPPRSQQSLNEPVAIDKPPKVCLDSVTLNGADSRLVKSDESPGLSGIFETQLYLRYSTTKLHRPMVHFNASAILKPVTAISRSPSPDSEYLVSGAAEPENLLENLLHSGRSASPHGRALSLPASRLIKLAPRASSMSAEIRPLRMSSKLLPIVPILTARVSSTTAALASESLTSLDLELTRYASCSVEIQSVSVQVHGSRSVCLTESLQASLVLYPGDRSVLLYKLVPDADRKTLDGPVDHALEVDIVAAAQLTESCKPALKVQWRGIVNPSVGRISGHWQRPGSISSRFSEDSMALRSVNKHLSMTGRPQSIVGSDLGVTIAFSGPPTVHNGQTFHLDVFVVNRSSRKKRLAIVAVPRAVKSVHASVYGARPFSADSAISTRRREIAEAVTDSRSLFNQQSRNQDGAAEVVSLNADVRIGPLPPGTCHNVQLEFLALSRGFVGLSAIQIVDLELKETHEITDLPVIEVLDIADEDLPTSSSTPRR